LRIEDIDRARCRREFETAILEDLAWLGLRWEQPVRRQSEHGADYQAALGRLEARGVLYPCFCTRAAIAAEIAGAAAAPHAVGPLYPGTCRRLDPGERHARVAAGEAHGLRLDAAKAAEIVGPLHFRDLDRGEHAVDPRLLGDVVLARKDAMTSYHLAVTVDDYLQGVTLVTRGSDLLEATHVHRLLQALLGYAAPLYRHHRLLTDSAGKRLAKRSGAQTLRALRQAGRSADQVREMLEL
jgi:glutamyl-Q tRNA(Asp) synthetase